MFEFLARNPLCLLGMFCTLWPGLLPMMLFYWIGRNGSPLEIKWRRKRVTTTTEGI